MYHGYVYIYIYIIYYSSYASKTRWKTIAVKPRLSIFEKCLKSCFDTVERKISARAFDPAKIYLFTKQF